MLVACASGFHTASHTELQNLASYVYDSVLGTTTEDSGSGAPVNVTGWIRTGEGGVSASPNCSDWTFGGVLGNGSIMHINSMSSQSAGLALYEYSTDICATNNHRVWCVEDGSPG